MRWYGSRFGSRFGWVPALYSLVLSVLILGPMLGPGYLLLRDAVTNPDGGRFGAPEGAEP